MNNALEAKAEHLRLEGEKRYKARMVSGGSGETISASANWVTVREDYSKQLS